MTNEWDSEPTSFTICLSTVYGPMLVNRFDINQTNSLIKTMRAIDNEETSILVQLLELFPQGRVVIDVGANSVPTPWAALAALRRKERSTASRRNGSYHIC